MSKPKDVTISTGKGQERIGIVRTVSQVVRGRVSRENRQEYDNEKRALELNARMPCGHPHAKAVAIAKMMNIPEQQARKYLDNRQKTKVVLDGKID